MSSFRQKQLLNHLDSRGKQMELVYSFAETALSETNAVLERLQRHGDLSQCRNLTSESIKSRYSFCHSQDTPKTQTDLSLFDISISYADDEIDFSESDTEARFIDLETPTLQ